MKKLKIAYRNRLPHIAPVGATFFITFRLADSLPQQIIRDLKRQMDAAIAKLEAEKKEGYLEQIKQQRNIFFKRYDHQLETKPYGACYLKNPQVAEVVSAKLHALDGDKYALIAYCLMPNHVHLMFDMSIQVVDEQGLYLNELPDNYFQLHQIMKLIKGSTAYYANKILDRKGSFWQKDTYDHYIRNEKSFWNILRYILQNPVKAKLANEWYGYPYTYLADEYKAYFESP